MLELYFESNEEVISFCEYLFHYSKRIELHWKTDEDWGNRLQIAYQLTEHEMVNAIAKAMTDVFVEHRLTKLINTIITDCYYYSDAIEIERIMDLTQWIFSGEDIDRKWMQDEKDSKRLLLSLFIANIKNNTTVHYDSIVNFRLRAFRDQLIHLVGVAIDEFKREEEHQEFINTLREYILKKETRYPIIHVLQGSSFLFFKKDGKRFSENELRSIMKKEPLYIVGLDGDEFNLAPLIALSPNKIKIYGDHPSEPKTMTVINVFQEKVEFVPYHDFPFPIQLKNQ
ncbi:MULTISPECIES: putative sporulation protein YtxC [unclassified Virgibacillus]|uniref:putative sporulation protein YtxC n=1 Tax=unclassified Virgibacillus TaxID=2620237 RepID=UPI0024DEA952|nr:putative sporulation protein YtxC [Virgibacillus sp. LDC-1]